MQFTSLAFSLVIKCNWYVYTVYWLWPVSLAFSSTIKCNWLSLAGCSNGNEMCNTTCVNLGGGGGCVFFVFTFSELINNNNTYESFAVTFIYTTFCTCAHIFNLTVNPLWYSRLQVVLPFSFTHLTIGYLTLYKANNTRPPSQFWLNRQKLLVLEYGNGGQAFVWKLGRREFSCFPFYVVHPVQSF
jgi:hypothetical protein